MKKPKACIFDAFGTLFNLEFPLTLINEKTGGKGDELLQIWRRKQLEYTWLRSMMDNYAPFSTVTKEALTYAMNRLGIKDQTLYDILLPIYHKATAFPEVKPCLQRLQQQGITTAILSNGTLEMLYAGTKNSEISDYLHAIISVDSIGFYKPMPEVYQFALDRLKVKAEDALFFSSNQWDIIGATHFGMQTVWVNKYGQAKEVLAPKAKFVIKSLDDVFV